eukprot:757252-Hanusia_phi.AAC.2
MPLPAARSCLAPTGRRALITVDAGLEQVAATEGLCERAGKGSLEPKLAEGDLLEQADLSSSSQFGYLPIVATNEPF